MSISSRLTLCNLAAEFGAKCALISPDNETLGYLRARARRTSSEPVIKSRVICADAGASYAEKLSFDCTELEPQVACPHRVDNVKPVGAVEGIELDQAFIGSCANGRLEDLELASQLLRKHRATRIAATTRFIVAPASQEVYLKALHKGILRSFIRAGAIVLNPGCGPCIGAHQGVLAPSERCIASTARNFRGRMGSPDAEIYLASPATVTASAIEGKITDPRKFL
jgi:homoaconitase/3-isopropylmalate dehydratase large subunit